MAEVKVYPACTSTLVRSHHPDGEALVPIFTVAGNVDTGGWSGRGMVPAADQTDLTLGVVLHKCSILAINDDNNNNTSRRKRTRIDVANEEQGF